jgi:hypothetical protein
MRMKRALMIITGFGVTAALVVIGSMLVLRPRASESGAREMAEDKWGKRSFTDYRIHIDTNDQDDTQCGYTVSGNQISGVIVEQPTPNHCYNYSLTVDDLFWFIRETEPDIGSCGPNGCDCNGRLVMAATYDQALGYPTSLYFDYGYSFIDLVLAQTKRHYACTLVGWLPLDLRVSVTPLP